MLTWWGQACGRARTVMAALADAAAPRLPEPLLPSSSSLASP